MKIEVDKIKREPLRICEDIPAGNWDIDSFDIKFLKNIRLVGDFCKIDKEILVDIRVTLNRLITCSRCLKEVEQKINKNFELSYDAVGLGEYLEVDKDVREELLLDFPMKVLCKPDCKGICPECGVDLNNQECACIEKNDSAVKRQKFTISVAEG